VDSATLPVCEATDWEELVSEWANRHEQTQSDLWGLAAVAFRARQVFGRDGVRKFAREVGYSPRRMNEMAFTYEGWQGRTPSIMKGFHHHTLAARYRPEDPEAAIHVAEDEDLGVRAFERRLKGATEEEAIRGGVRQQACVFCAGEGSMAVQEMEQIETAALEIIVQTATKQFTTEQILYLVRRLEQVAEGGGR
jgi:hypothetical protein